MTVSNRLQQARRRARLLNWKALPAAFKMGARGLREAILPADCTICGVGIDAPDGKQSFCSECVGALPWWRRADGCPLCGDLIPTSAARSRAIDAACPRCLASGSPLHRCHTLLRYEADVRRWIPGLKNAPGVFGPSMAILRSLDALVDELGRQLSPELSRSLDLLTSIPIHPRRLRARGFNQADWIAIRLAHRLALPFDPNCLRRDRHTRPQASLAGEERRRNVQHAFRALRPVEGDLRIGLIDDVLTTGSTLEAAGNTLLEAGALEVRAITLAATLPPSARSPRKAAQKPSCTYDPAPSAGIPL